MAPIALPTATVQPKTPAVRPAAITAKRAFALPELVAAADAAAAEPAETPASPKRSKLAAGGKTLPVRAKSGGKKDDKEHKGADPAFAWIAAMLPPPPDAPAKIALPSRGAPVSAVPGGEVAQPAAEARAADTRVVGATPATPAPADAATSIPQPVLQPTITARQPLAADAASPTQPATAQQADGLAIRDKADAPAQSPLRPLAVVPLTPAGGAPAVAQPSAQPAAQVFAEVIRAAQPALAQPVQRKVDPSDPAPLVLAAAGTAATPARPDAVPATAAPQREALDLTQDKGLQRMIDRIETLRDHADANDTRIRLTPAGLGTVDVAVRQQDGAVHVHFTAEQDATRALIAEAQPRLAELAEARGIRLGETSVSGGAADLARQQQQQRFAGQPSAPPRAPRSAFATETTDADTRVA